MGASVVSPLKLEIGHVYSGLEFNHLLNRKLYKCISKDEKHYGFQYKTGMNVDTIPFYPHFECRGGGLYFSTAEYVLTYSQDYDAFHLRRVVIPNDARVYVETQKYKADKIILEEEILYFDEDPKVCIEAIKQKDLALQYVKDQPPEICMEVVKQNGSALQFVKDQTPEICMEAVKRNELALQFVKDPKICMEAVKQNGFALEFVKDQTVKICTEAVKQNGYAHP